MNFPKYKGLVRKSILFVGLLLLLLLLDSMSYSHMSGLLRTSRPSATVNSPYRRLETKSALNHQQKGSSIISQKWIVMTSIRNPKEQIRRFSRIPGWTLLVVEGDKTSIKSAQASTIILTTKNQLNLNYSVIKFLPKNVYSRKIIGYLYAIQHGAKFIYDTDNNKVPKDLEKYFELKETTRGLTFNNIKKSTVTVNPYAHFGQPKIWPRGYPLEYIGWTSNNSYSACQSSTPYVQQGIVSGDPDVEGMYRLTKKHIKWPLNVEFDSSAPPLILSSKILAPFNSKNTIFHYKAFWAMFLPSSVDSRAADIWRGYWAQPLLWAIGSRLGFYSVPAPKHATRSNYRDFAGVELFKEATNLVRYLKGWECSGPELYQCMIELTATMAERKIWSRTEIQLVKSWISDLKSIGYRAPNFNSRKSPCLKGKPKSFTLFNGVEIKRGHQKKDHRNILRQLCKFPISTIKDDKSARPIQFSNTLLVVTFNFPHYENIWLLDFIYRPHYPNIVYCGDFYNSSIHAELLASERFLGASVNGFSFVRANVSKGIFAYECALRAIDMNYGVTGYLIISDDVLLNFWNNRDNNLAEVWSTTSTLSKSYSSNASFAPWKWWKSRYGLRGTKLALTKIHLNSLNIHVKEFRKQREEYGYSATSMGHGASDIFYLPKAKEDMFYEVGSILRKHEVFLEIAVPILMTGLSSPANSVHLQGKFLWDSDRMYPFNFFSESYNFIHPVKPSIVLADQLQRTEYCNYYVKKVLEFHETNLTELGKVY